MKILVGSTHHPVCSGRVMTEAYARIGVDVRHFGWENNWATVAPEKWWRTMSGYEAGYWPDWTPDLVVYMDTAYNPWVSKYPDVPHVVHSTSLAEMRMSTMEHYFVASRQVAAGKSDMTWLPNAHDPTLHTRSSLPFEDREYDVCLLGQVSPPTDAVGTALRRAERAERRARGLDEHEDIRRWIGDEMEQRGLRVFMSQGIYFEDYAAAYHNARIGLVVNRQNSLMWRCFETAAMGCAVLSCDIPDYSVLEPKGFTLFPMRTHLDGVHAAPSEADIAGVVDRAVELLDNPAQTKVKIEASVAWAQQHTWDERARTIVKWWETKYGSQS